MDGVKIGKYLESNNGAGNKSEKWKNGIWIRRGNIGKSLGCHPRKFGASLASPSLSGH